MQINSNISQPSFKARVVDNSSRDFKKEVLELPAKTQARYYNAIQKLSEVAPKDTIEISGSHGDVSWGGGFKLTSTVNPKQEVKMGNCSVMKFIKTLEKVANPASEEHHTLLDNRQDIFDMMA